MKAGQFKNLAGVFLNNTSAFEVVNFMIFVSLPTLIIFRERSYYFPYYLLAIYFGILYIASKYQKQKIINRGVRENGKRRFIWYYIILPLAAPIVMKMLANLLLAIFPIDSNPQGLKEYSLDQLLNSIIFNFFAGAEEVWRFSVILVVAKITYIICRQRFAKLSLLAGLLVSSFMFGWLHTFPYGGGWFNTDITIVLSLMGLMYGLLLFITRNLWSVILAHIIGNMYTTLSLYNSDLGVLIQYMVVGVVLIFLVYMSAKQNSKNKEANQTELQ